jgi:putative flavoprotein involved in K+ transport
MFDGLDGMRFPARSFSFPTKDEMADYLESYAQRFALPVRHGIRVDRLWHEGDRYVATAGNRRFEAQNVVVAMANYQVPWTPPVAAGLDPGIRQIHSRDYRNPSQLNPGSVLMVGGGNSGAEIAVELAGGHRIWMAGRDTGHVPFRTDGLLARLFMARFMLRVVFHRLLTLSTPMGRRARPDLISKGTRLIRVKPADLARAGVERVPRVAGVENGFPRLEDGRVLKPANVVWCTGFRPGFSWIDLPVMDATAEPVHQRGVVTAEPGLYFVGLHFLHALSSSMIHGVGRDVRYVVDVLTRRSKAAQAAGQSSGALTTRSETQVRAAV